MRQSWIFVLEWVLSALSYSHIPFTTFDCFRFTPVLETIFKILKLLSIKKKVGYFKKANLCHYCKQKSNVCHNYQYRLVQIKNSMQILSHAWALILNNVHVLRAHSSAHATCWNHIFILLESSMVVIHSSECCCGGQETWVSSSYGIRGSLWSRWLQVVLFPLEWGSLGDGWARGKTPGESFTCDSSGEPSLLTGITETIRAKAIPRIKPCQIEELRMFLYRYNQDFSLRQCISCKLNSNTHRKVYLKVFLSMSMFVHQGRACRKPQHSLASVP